MMQNNSMQRSVKEMTKELINAKHELELFKIKHNFETKNLLNERSYLQH